MFNFLLCFRRLLTLNVFVRVTIGIGEQSHRLKASARELSCGLICVFIIYDIYYLEVQKYEKIKILVNLHL
jgi:hypothetical protein